jgi:hypothetical protein
MKIKIQENEKGMNSARPESGPQPRYAGPAQRRKLADRPVPAAPCGRSHRVSMRTWWRAHRRRVGGRGGVRFSR